MLASQTLLNAIEKFTHSRENRMIPYSTYTGTISNITDSLIREIRNN